MQVDNFAKSGISLDIISLHSFQSPVCCLTIGFDTCFSGTSFLKNVALHTSVLPKRMRVSLANSLHSFILFIIAVEPSEMFFSETDFDLLLYFSRKHSNII